MPPNLSENSGFDKLEIQRGTEASGIKRRTPGEVKDGKDKSAPSFKKYIADHQPEHALRFSKHGYRKDGAIINIPLYLARKTRELL